MKFGKHKIVYLIILFLAIMIYGCKDDSVSSIPEITFFSPGLNQEFSVFDTIQVNALITDNMDIKSVKMNLTDENLITAGPAITWSPDSKSFEVLSHLIIEGDLESGTYYILIKAENESNFKNKYQKILIKNIEPELKQMIVISEKGTNLLGVTGISDYETPGLLFETQGDYAASEISPENRMLFIAGQNTLNLKAFDLVDNELVWEKGIQPGKPMHNTNSLYFDQTLYTGFNFDFILGYSELGDITFNVSIEEHDAPYTIFRHNDYILSEIRKKNSGEPFIATYYKLTGAEKQRTYIDFEVIQFFSKDDNNVIIAGNQLAGNGIIAEYNIETNHMNILSQTMVIADAAELEVGKLILAGINPNGLIQFDLNILDYIWLLTDTPVSQLVFEPIDSKLITTFGQEINVYQYPQMENQKTLMFPDPILCILLDYSR